jgi:hypothetical protein
MPGKPLALHSPKRQSYGPRLRRDRAGRYRARAGRRWPGVSVIITPQLEFLEKRVPSLPRWGRGMNLGGPAGDAHLHNSMTLTEIRTRQGSAIPPGAADAAGLFGGSLSQWVKAWTIRGPTKGGSTRCRKHNLALVPHLDCLAADLIAELNDFLRCRRERLTAATSFC